MTRRERRGANRTFALFATLGVLAIGAVLWHFTDDVITDLVVYVPTSNKSVSAQDWIKHLREAGFHVHVVKEGDPGRRREWLHIPEKFSATIYAMSANPNRYVFAGLVPPSAITRILHEHPNYQGLAVNADGSNGWKPAPDVWGFWSDGHEELYVPSRSEPIMSQKPIGL